VSPRYDIPKAAPEPLRQVQLFVNSIDLHNGVEWLPDWLTGHDLDGEAARARELREALRSLLLAHNGAALDRASLEVFNAAARRVSLRLDSHGRVHPATDGDALDRLMVTVLGAVLDGSWTRLKACPNCCWSFYDYSPNRSATWCSMQLCGNRTKTRAYRRRRASTP
jgi:predicted RNA-binding Zn ribbon-like protein